MMLTHWLRSWKTRTLRWTRRHRVQRPSRPLAAEIQSLEHRLLLTSYVVTTLDDPPEFGTDGQVSLREAILAANTNMQIGDAPAGEVGGAGGVTDTITFANSLAGSTLTLLSGVLSITDDLNITGLGSSQFTIDAQDETGIFDVSGAITVSLSGLTLRNGFAIDGGAIHNQDANLTLDHVVLSGNTAFGMEGGGSGGGLYNLAGNVTIRNSTISGNSAASGGGVFNSNGTLTIQNTTISNNTALYGGGVGNLLFSSNPASSVVTPSLDTVTLPLGIIRITGSSITNNSAEYDGGGVDNEGGTITIGFSTISQNSAGYHGGGIYNFQGESVSQTGGQLTLAGSTVSQNTAFSGGGGIYNDSGTAKIMDSTLSGNAVIGNSSTAGGGGIYNAGTTQLVNSTLSGNLANEDGGGIYNYDNTVVITNSTLVANRADADGNESGAGGGIWTYDDSATFTSLYNTIVAGNVQGSPDSELPNDIANKNVESGSGYNIISDPSSDGGLAQGSHNLVGQDDGMGGRTLLDYATVVDPNLADNGGPTLTHNLFLGSPAIDAGNNAFAVDPGPDGMVGTADDVPLSTDQRGFPRIADVPGIPNAAGGVDIGAVEFQPQVFDIFPLDALKREGNAGVTHFTFLVTRSGNSSGAASVNFVIAGITADANDFAPGTPLSGTVSFADGQTSRILTLGVQGDVQLERNEFFTVNLTNPSPGATIQRASATGEIFNDETLEVFGAGSGAGIQSMPPQVIVKLAATGAVLHNFNAYDANFRRGVRVAAADVNGDGVADIITGPGPGGGPHVEVFDGLTGQTIASFFAYDPGFAGGVFVAGGDVNGDGHADIITGAGAGGGPHVKVFDGLTGQTIASFFAYDPGFAGGVTVAGGDVNGDSHADIITGAGAGGGPHVKVFDGLTGQTIASFFAYDPGFAGGVTVAGGDVNGDGRADIITGAGPGGGPHLKVFDGRTLQLLASFFAFDPNQTTGLFVGVTDLNGDGLAEILVGPGSGSPSFVRVFNASGGLLVSDTLIFNPHFRSGVHVGGSTVPQIPQTNSPGTSLIPPATSLQSELDQVFNQSLLELL